MNHKKKDATPVVGYEFNSTDFPIAGVMFTFRYKKGGAEVSTDPLWVSVPNAEDLLAKFSAMLAIAKRNASNQKH